MLNFYTLNDREFEELCADIMTRKLGIQFRQFSSGRDKGIDLINENENIIVQVKHFSRSSFSQLRSALKKEQAKVARLNPKQYYICCSNELTHSNIQEIYLLFSKYMDSCDNIITGIEINDFFKDVNNSDILKLHFKLWLSHTSVLETVLNGDILIDSEHCFHNIQSDAQRFVQTSAYDESLKILNFNKALFITGAPGVGKSMTSKMLVLHYVNQGYKVRYTTSVAELSSIKKALTTSPQLKEIVFLDDCLGQAYFEIKSGQGRELVALINHIKNTNTKKIILNSRITIFNDARLKDAELESFFEDEHCKIHIIDMNLLNFLEKAKILYNHLYFTHIPSSHFCSLLQNKDYINIIKHHNYNPRIIEHVTKKINYEQIHASEYLNYIYENLNNPLKVWDNEYQHKLQPADRALLRVIHSLTDTSVPYEYVKNCYNETVSQINGIDTSINNFNNSLIRLNESFVKIVDEKSRKTISMINPSVNDYLDSQIKDNLSEQKSIISKLCSIDQLRRLDKKLYYTHTLRVFQSGEILNYVFSNGRHKRHCIIYFVGIYKIQDTRYRHYVTEFFEECEPLEPFSIKALDSTHTNAIKAFLEDDLFEYYEIDAILNSQERFTNLFKSIDFDELSEIINIIYEYSKYDSCKILCVKNAIEESIQFYLENNYEYDDILGNLFEEEYYYGNENKCIVEAEAKVINDAIEVIDSLLLLKLPEELSVNFNDYEQYVDVSWVSDSIDDYFNTDPDAEPYFPEDHNHKDRFDLKIIDMFQSSTLNKSQ